VPKKPNLRSEKKIGFRVEFGFFALFLHFWRLRIGLKKLLGLFIGILG
jgi:hypothetical protein